MRLLASVLVSVWLVATVLAQLPYRVRNVIRRFDPYGVIPAWTFFAPSPGISDPVLIARDRLDDGTWSPWSIRWREQTKPLRFLWRPGKRVAKLVTDCASSLPRTNVDDTVPYSVSFLLLGFIAAHRMTHDHRAVAWQFAVVDIADWHTEGEPTVLAWFRSPELGLDEREQGWMPRTLSDSVP